MSKRWTLPCSTVIGEDIGLGQEISICFMVSPIRTQLKKLHKNKLTNHINEGLTVKKQKQRKDLYQKQPFVEVAYVQD